MSKKAKGAQPKKIYLGRPTNNVSIGIVGMPNIGKSSLFNLLSKLNVPSENYPFCTIDPSFAKVPVPDERFDKLVELYKPKSIIPAVLTIHDIAGLVRGASEGQGLGNAFLSHIQAVDAIFHVCRAFRDKHVTHVENSVDPCRDLDIISNELILKDLALVTNQWTEVERLIRMGRDKSKERLQELTTLTKAKECLEAGTDIREYPWGNEDVDILNKLQLLTAKPIVYLVNISKKDYFKKHNKYLPEISEWVKKRSPDSPLIPFSVSFEQEWLDKSDEERDAWTNPEAEEGKEEKLTSMMPRIITTGYHALRLIHFFTAGSDEVRAWTIKQGLNAPQAAGVIHSDIMNHFIMADIFSFEDLIKYGSENEIKKNGRLQQRGKDYEMKDGEIVFFRHNAGGKEMKSAHTSRSSAAKPRAHAKKQQRKHTTTHINKRHISTAKPHNTMQQKMIAPSMKSFVPSTMMTKTFNFPTFQKSHLLSMQHRNMSGWGYTNYLPADEVESRIISVLQNIPEVEPSKVTKKSHFTKDLGLDSLQQVELIMLLEHEFNTEIDDQHAILIETIPEAVHYFSHTPYCV